MGEIAPKLSGFKPLIENSNTSVGVASTSGNNSMAAGPGAVAVAESTISIGARATATGQKCIVIGTLTNTQSDGSVIVGDTATITGSSSNSIVIGRSASLATGSGSSVIIGTSSMSASYNPQSVIIGNSASNGYSGAGPGGIAIGASAIAGNSSGISLGYQANSGSSSWSITNIAIGRYATCTGGSPNTNTGSIVIGDGASINAGAGTVPIVSSIIIGQGSTSKYSAAISLGWNSSSDFNGSVTFNTGNFSALGDVGVGLFPIFTQTTDAVASVLGVGQGTFTTSPASRIILTNNSTYIFNVDIIARNGNTDYSAWTLKFAITRGANAASTALIGAVSKTLIGQTAGAVTWDITAVANTSSGRPDISVTGEAAKTIRWVGSVRMTKVAG